MLHHWRVYRLKHFDILLYIMQEILYILRKKKMKMGLAPPPQSGLKARLENYEWMSVSPS